MRWIRQKGWKKRWKRLRRRLGANLRSLWDRLVELFLRVSGELQRRAVVARLQLGDIILACPRTRRLSPAALAYRLLLGARFVHSMLYIGQGRILHTTSKRGVVVSGVPRRIYRRDRYAIYRMPGLSEEDRRAIVARALEWKGKKLDLAGLLTNVPGRMLGLKRALWVQEEGRVWCSKLIARAYLEAGFPILPQEELNRVTSEDLAKSDKLVRVR